MEPTSELPQAPKLPLRIKANLKEYYGRVGAWRVTLALVIILVVFFRFGPLVWLAVIAATALLVFGILFMLSRRAVTFNEDSIQVHSAFGTTKTVSYKDVNGVKVFMGYIEAGFGHSPRLIVGLKNNKPLFSMTTLYWDAKDIDLVQATFQSKGIKVEAYEDVVVSATIAKEFPGYVAYYERHPYILAALIVAAIVVAVTVFVLLTL